MCFIVYGCEVVQCNFSTSTPVLSPSQSLKGSSYDTTSISNEPMTMNDCVSLELLIGADRNKILPPNCTDDQSMDVWIRMIRLLDCLKVKNSTIAKGLADTLEMMINCIKVQISKTFEADVECPSPLILLPTITKVMRDCPYKSVIGECFCETCQILIGSVASTICCPLLVDYLSEECVQIFVIQAHRLFSAINTDQEHSSGVSPNRSISWTNTKYLLIGCLELPQQSLRHGPAQSLCLLYRDLLHCAVETLRSTNPAAPYGCASSILGYLSSICLFVKSFRLLDRDTLTMFDMPSAQFELLVIDNMYSALNHVSFDFAWETMLSALSVMICHKLITDGERDQIGKSIDIILNHVENSSAETAIHASNLISFLSIFHHIVQEPIIISILNRLENALVKRVPDQLRPSAKIEKEYYQSVTNALLRWILAIGYERANEQSIIQNALKTFYELIEKLRVFLSGEGAGKQDISEIMEVFDWAISHLMCKLGPNSQDDPFFYSSSYFDIDECSEANAKFFFVEPDYLISILEEVEEDDISDVPVHSSKLVIRQRCGKFVWMLKRNLLENEIIHDEPTEPKENLKEISKWTIEHSRQVAQNLQEKRSANERLAKSGHHVLLEDPPWSSTVPAGFDFLRELVFYLSKTNPEFEYTPFSLPSQYYPHLEKAKEIINQEIPINDLCAESVPEEKRLPLLPPKNILHFVHQFGWLSLFKKRCANTPIAVECDEQLLRELRHFDTNLSCRWMLRVEQHGIGLPIYF